MQVGLHFLLIAQAYSQADSQVQFQNAKFAAVLFQNAQFLTNSQYGWLKQATNSDNYNGSIQTFQQNVPQIVNTVFNVSKSNDTSIKEADTHVNSTVICVVAIIKHKKAVKCVPEAQKDLLLQQMNSTLEKYSSYTINNQHGETNKTKFEIYRFNISDNHVKIDFSDFKPLLTSSTKKSDSSNIINTIKSHIELENNISSQINPKNADIKALKALPNSNLAQAEINKPSSGAIFINLHKFPIKQVPSNYPRSGNVFSLLKFSIPVFTILSLFTLMIKKIVGISLSKKSSIPFKNIKDKFSEQEFLFRTLETLKYVQERGHCMTNISEYNFMSSGDIKSEFLEDISCEKTFGPKQIQQLGNLVKNYWPLSQISIEFQDLIDKMTSNNLDEVPSILEALAHPVFMNSISKYNFLKNTAVWLAAFEKAKRKGTISEIDCEAYQNFRICIEQATGSNWPEVLCPSSNVFFADKVVSNEPQAVVNYIIKSVEHCNNCVLCTTENVVSNIERVFPKFYIQIYDWVIHHYQKSQSISHILFC